MSQTADTTESTDDTDKDTITDRSVITPDPEIDPEELTPEQRNLWESIGRELIIGHHVDESNLPVIDLPDAYSHYDPPFDVPESEQHVPFVTPRAFPTEIGYDIPATQIPTSFGQTLRSRADRRELVAARTTTDALRRQINHDAGSIDTSDDLVQFLVERDAYISIEVYRFDDPAPDGPADPNIDGCGNGGYLIRYVGRNPRNETPPVEGVHDHIGYYVCESDGYQALLETLFGPDGYDEGWAVVDMASSPGWVTRKKTRFTWLRDQAAFPDRLPDLHTEE